MISFRFLIVRGLLLVAATSMWAQSTLPAPLQSLNFLQGIWTLQNGQAMETTEFHWSVIRGNRFLVGRSWSGVEGACPWCVTQTAMVAKYDPTRNQVRVHLVDISQHVLDFRLVAAGQGSAQFLTEAAAGLPAYRLTYALSKSGGLLATIEKQADWDGGFVPVFQEKFKRR